MITLATVAKDNHGHSYPVTLSRSRYGVGLVVTTEAGGGWAASDFLKGSSDVIFIDLGQDWKIVNKREIVKELRQLFGAQ